MNRSFFLLAAFAIAALPPSFAASTAASSASDSASTSVGSLSTSIQRSSDSSSKTAGVAAGPYRVTDVAVLDDRPTMLRVALQAQAPASAQQAAAPADGHALVLILPREAAERGRLARGEWVVARPRPYGVEFARGADGEAFFLVLHDEWHRELPSRPVTL